MRSFFIEVARKKAREVLRRFGVRAREHIRLEDFAETLGARIEYGPLDGADAQLLRINNRPRILVSTTRPMETGARRWSIAHELGHFVLEHWVSLISSLWDPTRSQRHRDESRRDFEAEADAFAAELLMPTALARHRCQVEPIGLGLAKEIERDFDVSILAAASRVTELASARCAAVFSEAARIKWFRKSSAFPFELEPNTALDERSLAHAFFTRGAVETSPRRVPASAWRASRHWAHVVEHAVCSRKYGTVLSMLWLPEPLSAESALHG